MPMVQFLLPNGFDIKEGLNKDFPLMLLALDDQQMVVYLAKLGVPLTETTKHTDLTILHAAALFQVSKPGNSLMAASAWT